MEGVEILKIADNNPDGLFVIGAIIVGVYIIVNLITIKIKKNRRERLKDVREKIINRQEIMEAEYAKREQE